MESVKNAVFLNNCTTTTTLPKNKTPYEIWYGRKPDISHIKAFGCLTYVLIRKPDRENKYGPTSDHGILVGHTEHNRNYKVFMLKDSKIDITHDASFREDVYPFTRLPVFDISHLTTEDEGTTMLPLSTTPTPIVDDDDKQNQITVVEQHQTQQPIDDLLPIIPPPAAPRRTTRDIRPVDRYVPHSSITSNMTFWEDDCVIEGGDVCAYAFAVESTVRLIAEPGSYKQAMKSPNTDEWVKACDKEFGNMCRKGVWKIVDRPDAPIVGSRWHFKVKLHPDGSIVKHKARIVAKGFTQTFGVDYNQTYAPTGKPASYRIVIAIASKEGWEVHGMDTVAAFLNSGLKELVYMEQPEGYVKTGDESKVCLLLQALYGL